MGQSSMKVLHYGSRGADTGAIDRISEGMGLEFERVGEPLGMANAGAARGCRAVWLSTSSAVGEGVARALAGAGVKYIVSNAAGYDHLDVGAIRASGLKASNVPAYSPNAISEYTILLALSLLRKLKPTLRRVAGNDFTLAGLRGREICSMTAGVVGTGRIGSETARTLAAFGGRVVAHDARENPKLAGAAEYMPLDALFGECGIIMFHCPLTEETRHIVDARAISLMRDGVCLVNTARGGLFDFEAVRGALDSGKVGALAFDVYENEHELLRNGEPGVAPPDPLFCDLAGRDNVIYSPHASFFTDRSVDAMMRTSIENLREYLTTGACRYELT